MLTIPNRTKVRVKAATDFKIKLGQKEFRDSISLRLKAKLANDVLEQLSPELRRVIFEKSTAPPKNSKKGGTLEGFEASDLNALTTVGQRLGSFHWIGEQTGCRLVVDRGMGDKSNIELDGTVKGMQITPFEGGGVEMEFTFNAMPAESIDDITLGRLFKTGKRDIFVTLHGPQVDDAQQAIGDGEQPAAGTTLTPLKALKTSVEGEGATANPPVDADGEKGAAAWPFPTSGKDKPTVTRKGRQPEHASAKH